MSRSALFFVLLALATAALFAADLAVGSVALSPGEVWVRSQVPNPTLPFAISC